jgi:hypothetical protein
VTDTAPTGASTHQDADLALAIGLWNPGSGGSPRKRRLGIAHDHGIPVTLASC